MTHKFVKDPQAANWFFDKVADAQEWEINSYSVHHVLAFWTFMSHEQAGLANYWQCGAHVELVDLTVIS